MVYYESHVYSESRKKVVQIPDPWIPKRQSLYSLLKSCTIPHFHRVGRWRLSSCKCRSPKEDVSHPDTGVIEALIHAAHPMLPIFNYAHKPANSENGQIRLLDVRPGKGTEPLECTTHWGDPDRIPYETISYCWGKDPGNAVILIDGIPVKVTKSAAEALQRMRSPLARRVLWIDAICVDQACDEEKSAQVAIMGEIYENTVRNLVWLGHDHGKANSLTKCLQQLHENMLSATGSYKYWKHVVAGLREPDGVATNGHSLDVSIDLQPLKMILSSVWFSRRWVAQEVVLAPSSLCHFGSASFPIENLLRATVWAHHNVYKAHAFGVSTIKESMDALGLWILTEQIDPFRDEVTLLQAWNLLGRTDASNEADRVYALLGLLRVKYRGRCHQLDVDYTQSPKEVFCSATRAMVEQSGAGALQNIEATGGSHPQHQPSWMFTFDQVDHHPNPFAQNLYEAHLMLISDKADLRDIPNSDPDVLTLRGFCVSEVAEYTPYFDTHQNLPDRVSHLAFLNAAGRLSHTLRTTSSASKHDVWIGLACTLVAGVTADGLVLTGGAALRLYNKYQDHVWRTGDSTCHLSRFATETRAGYAEMYSEASVNVCEGRRFFVTRDGRMGLGPKQMLAGDVVVVVVNSQLPLVLRRVTEKRYEFVGAAYVHGVMRGEAAEAHRESMEPLVDFDLI